jgi:hypothetical protein
MLELVGCNLVNACIQLLLHASQMSEELGIRLMIVLHSLTMDGSKKEKQ